MTREERAREALAKHHKGAMLFYVASEAMPSWAIKACLAFADAEAAAMRERAAKLCDERGAEEQKGFGLTRGAQNYFRARDAIRALPATGEVGR